MNYEEFKDYIENRVAYETIYQDSEGRMILVITMLGAYTAMNRKWVGLTDDEIDKLNIVGHESLREFVRSIEAKLKEKNQ